MYDCVVVAVQGDGVAYRGRVLLELVTVLDETPQTPVEDISDTDVVRVQVATLHVRFTHCKQYPHIHRHSVASFSYFSVYVRICKSTE